VTDAELLVASRHDPAAFRELYDRWAERLLAYFYRRVFDPEVAADLLAETFAVAYERRHRFRDMGRPGSAWLFGIAQKELAHWARHRAAEQRASGGSASSGPPWTTSPSPGSRPWPTWPPTGRP
jgi:DNA-directed RNA polymerase specialized sigma24 family protein